jgi:hypothetical protein
LADFPPFVRAMFSRLLKRTEGTSQPVQRNDLVRRIVLGLMSPSHSQKESPTANLSIPRLKRKSYGCMPRWYHITSDGQLSIKCSVTFGSVSFSYSVLVSLCDNGIPHSRECLHPELQQLAYQTSCLRNRTVHGLHIPAISLG